MKVLGRATSGNVQKVLFLMEELGVEYTREDYGRTFNNTSTAEYLAINPTGKVPSLVDGDTAVWESHTILRYIAAKSGSELLPSDLSARTRVECWMDWLLATLNGTYVSLFKATKDGGTGPEDAVKELGAALKLLDEHLAASAFVAGDTLTLGDIALGPIIHRCLGFPVERPALPNLTAWHERMLERPAFQKAISGK